MLPASLLSAVLAYHHQLVNMTLGVHADRRMDQRFGQITRWPATSPASCTSSQARQARIATWPLRSSVMSPTTVRYRPWHAQARSPGLCSPVQSCDTHALTQQLTMLPARHHEMHPKCSSKHGCAHELLAATSMRCHPDHSKPCMPDGPVTVQVDVYAFAMIAFELFEGRIPFGGEKPMVAAQRAAMDRQRPVFGTTNRYITWLQACVHHKPLAGELECRMQRQRLSCTCTCVTLGSWP